MLMYKYHTGNISVVYVWVIPLTDISNKEISPELEVCNWSPAAYNQFQIENGRIADTWMLSNRSCPKTNGKFYR